MAGFSTRWLDLREAADAASRSHSLVRHLAAHLRPTTDLRIADLGAGTGANLRWLAPQLSSTQHWQLLEGDGALIDGMSPRLAAWARTRGMSARPRTGGLDLGDRIQVSWHGVDLALEPLPLDRMNGDPPHLVTASALADLVSAHWLARLARCCARQRSAALLAISYDGRARLDPPHPFDGRARDALNRHQHRDKGFGMALGPDCVSVATQAFQRHGYRVMQARSDWRLTAHDRELAQAHLDGWREAATEVLDAQATGELYRWHAWHTRAVQEGAGEHCVGHVDLLALPAR